MQRRSRLIVLKELGHKQGKTPIISDNTTIIGITNKMVLLKDQWELSLKEIDLDK